MKRVDADGFAANKNGVGRNGFTDDEPNPTTIEETWLNHVQEEIARTIELAGDTLDENDKEQLHAAIVAIANARFPAGAADNAIARFDGTTGKLLQSSGVLIEDDNDITGAKDITASGAITGGSHVYATPPTRTVLLFADALRGLAWTPLGDSTVLCNRNSSFACAKLPVPQGATLTSVRVALCPGASRATPADRMQVKLRRVTGISTSGVPVNTVTGWTDATDDGTALGQIVGDTSINHILAAGDAFKLEVTSGNTAGSANDNVYGIEIVYTETNVGGPA